MTEDIVIRYLLKETNNDENRDVERWIEESDENKKNVEQLYYLLEVNNKLRVMNSIDTDQALELFNKQLKKKQVENKKHHVFKIFQRIAAILFLPLICSSLYLFLSQDMHQVEIIEMKTNSGMISSFKLPDGSKVWLNSNSYIRYPSKFDGENRVVEVEGQAYFKVEKNIKQPFIVKVFDNRIKVKVLGTEFDLQAYKKDKMVQTTLVTGSIQLDIEGQKERIILKPSEKAIYSFHSNRLQITNVDTDRETDWMYSRLVFKDTPMKEVLARLGRFYNVEFDVKNNIINTYTFTGTFKGKPLYLVLDYMKISSKINYEVTYPKDQNGTKSIIVLRKQ